MLIVCLSSAVGVTGNGPPIYWSGEHSRHSGHSSFLVVPAFRSFQLTSGFGFLAVPIILAFRSSHFTSIKCSKRIIGVANSLQHVAFVLGNSFPRSKTNTLHCHLPDPPYFSLPTTFKMESGRNCLLGHGATWRYTGQRVDFEN